MIEPLLDLYAKNLAYARHLLADVHTEQATYQPAAGVNHPLWLLGHLVMAGDRVAAAGLLGLEPQLPDRWNEVFGPWSEPGPNTGQYPPLNELLTAHQATHARVDEACRALDPQALTKPTPFERLADRFPTLGHSLTHVLVAHETLHLGQLSAWRRVLGYEPAALS